MTRSANTATLQPLPGSLGAWVIAARPKTLPAALAPVAVGSACAHAAGLFRIGPALGALFGALLLQIAANFANDVFDYEKGADTEERVGPTRAVQSGLLAASAVRLALVLVLLAALGVGAYLTWVAGPLIVGLGLASMLAALAYTGGPYPLGYHGLGDLFVFLFFGLIAVTGSAFVHARIIPELAYWTAIPVGALATAILVVNNLRDRETDARAGKRTLAVRWGRNGAILEYWVLIGIAVLMPPLLWAFGLANTLVLLPLLTAPPALGLCRAISREDGARLNDRLAETARLAFLYSALLAFGIVLQGYG